MAEYQDNCTYGLGHKLIIQRKIDNHALSHPAGAVDAANFVFARRVNIDDQSLYVPHYTPGILNQKLMLGHMVSKAATELSFIKRSSNMKDKTSENNWTCELGVGDGIDKPIYVIVGFMQRDHFNQHHRSNNTFCRPSVVNAQCIIEGEKLPDAGTNCNYAVDKYSQAYGEIVSVLDIYLKIIFYKQILHKNILQLLIIIQMVTLVIIYTFLILVVIKVIALLKV